MRDRVGFTLLELLVAVFVSAVLLALGYAAINQVIARRADLQNEQRALDDLRRTWALLALDVGQMEPRPVRDSAGTGLEGAFQLDAREGRLMALTRSAQQSALGAERPALQRVEWRLEQGSLWRVSQPVLDGSFATAGQRRRLLDDVRAVQIRGLDADGAWHTSWPPLGGQTGTGIAGAARVRPIVVEITLDTTRFGVMTRLIEVPG